MNTEASFWWQCVCVCVCTYGLGSGLLFFR